MKIVYEEIEFETYDGDKEVLEEEEHVIDYKKVPDINGFRGVVEAGDPILQRRYSHDDGYRWGLTQSS